MSPHLRRRIACRAAPAACILAITACILALPVAWAMRRTTHWVRHHPAPRPPCGGPGPDDGRGCLTENEQLDFLAILAVSDLDNSEGSPT